MAPGSTSCLSLLAENCFIVVALTRLRINLVQKQLSLQTRGKRLATMEFDSVHHNLDNSPSTAQSRTNVYIKKSVMQHKSDASSRKVSTRAKGVHEHMTSPVRAPAWHSDHLGGRSLPSNGAVSLEACVDAPPPNPSKALLHVAADDALDGHAAKASEAQEYGTLEPLTPRAVDGPATTTRTRSVMMCASAIKHMDWWSLRCAGSGMRRRPRRGLHIALRARRCKCVHAGVQIWSHGKGAQSCRPKPP
jgi:hypothetical protein